jgi:2'-5' RNA ligase
MRLFVALCLPDEITASLQLLQAGVPGARWSTTEQMHLTLRFIGEVDGRVASSVDDALSIVRSRCFQLTLKDIGQFGGKSPNTLWVGVEPNAELTHLQRKVESALQRVGLPAETRKYMPHVTLARLKGTPRGRAIDFLTDRALYKSKPFDVRGFILYSSRMTPNGSIYRAEKAYQLQPQ